MAKTLDQIGIETGNTVEAYHVTQSIDAFTGVVAYDISLSGSFNMTGSINGEPLVVNPLTASYAITASYSENSLSSSYAVTASHAENALSSSYAVTASYVENAFIQNGNSFGTTARLGTNDSQALTFETNNSQRMNISDSGTVGIGDGNNGTLLNLLNANTASSDASSITLITLPTSAGIAYTVQAYVVGWGSGNGKIGGDVIGVFQNVAGTLTSAGTVIQNKIEDFTGAPDFTLTTSGTDIILQVTGQAATTINWAGHLKFISYDSTL